MTDKSLIDKYNEVYKAGEDKFWTFLPVQERIAVIESVDWTGKEVLEIGCGTGDLAAWIWSCGPKFVDACDPSIEAVTHAKAKYPGLGAVYYKNIDPLMERLKQYDVVVAVGVLEHLDDPESSLAYIMEKLVKPGGVALITCPCFVNVRGAIYNALRLLFDAPMSLTDKHYLWPNFFKGFCADKGYDLIMQSLDMDWASGRRMVEDFKQRLPKVFDQMWEQRMGYEEQTLPLKTNIDNFINWLEILVTHT